MTKFPTFKEVLPLVQEHIQEAQEMRKEAKKKIVRNFIIGLVLWGIVIASALMQLSGSITGTLVFVAFIATFVLIGLSVRVQKEMLIFYKKVIVNETLKTMFELIEKPEDEPNYRYKVRYSPTHYISTSTVSSSGLVDSFNKSTGEDYTKGQLGATTFEFSELDLKDEETYRDKDGKEQKRVKKIFKGVAFAADFHKDFMGSTFLIRKKFFNGRKLSLRTEGMFPIELESEKFNKTFETMTNDDIEARYILSSNLMERILEYTERAHGPVQISFNNSRMVILTETNKDLFEGKFWNSNDEATLREIYDEFMTYFKIIDEFTLNRRIWSKR